MGMVWEAYLKGVTLLQVPVEIPNSRMMNGDDDNDGDDGDEGDGGDE